MSREIYEIQGFTVVLDKIQFVSRIFEAREKEGFQFNIRFHGETLLSIKSATRADATLERELLVKTLRGQPG